MKLESLNTINQLSDIEYFDFMQNLLEQIQKFSINEIKTYDSEKIINYITSTNIRILIYLFENDIKSPTNELIESKDKKTAKELFNTIFSDVFFVQRLVDFEIYINVLFPKSFIDLAKSNLYDAIKNTTISQVDVNKKKKQLIKYIDKLFDRYNFIWIIFLLKNHVLLNPKK